MSELLIELADKLNEMGYWAIYRPGADILFCTIHTQDSLEASSLMTHIEWKDDRYRFTYFNTELPVIREFESEEELIAFTEEYYWKEQ
jgi:hypothetical protein